MIHICNWLLTRRCDLKCSYCRIVKDYNMPTDYPKMKTYHQNEMSTEYIIDCLTRLKKHNPNIFNIFYGGEPLLRDDLPDIINFCNKEDINYTIITNNSNNVQKRLEELFKKVNHVTGLSSSVDPLVVTDEPGGDRYKKCIAGFERLKQYKGSVKDLVAEMTVDQNNVDYMYDLVCMLHDEEINTDITFIDIAKSKYYDFSDITDESLLVQPTKKLELQLNKIIEEGLDVHMAKELLPRIFKILPSNLDCGIEKDVHTVAIDANGSVRLCLRIRGTFTPRLKLTSCIDKNGNVDDMLNHFINVDKRNYCMGCNHTCYIMPSIIKENNSKVNDLIHSKRRDFEY